MDIQTDQGLLVLNLDNVQALHQMSKGDCIYTLAVANPENDGTTMVQIPVSLQCNGNNINFQHPFSNNVNPAPQHTANIQHYTQQNFDQAQISEQLQCLLQSSEESSLAEKASFLPDTVLNISSESTPDQHNGEVDTEVPASDNADQDLEVDHQAIYNYIESNVVPHYASDGYIKALKKRSRNYSIINKTLYHGVVKLKKVIVDKEAQKKLLKDSHIVINTGVHLGVNKMYAAITASYFWKELYLDVANYVRQCEGCSERVVEETSDQPEGVSSHPNNLAATATNTNVWKTVEAQMHGPFNKTYQGYEYILSLTDPVSRWIVALPITDEELPIRMANFIFETFCLFGFAKCRVVNSCTKTFAVIQDMYREACEAVKAVCGDLSQSDTRPCAWVEDLVAGLVADHPDSWDRKLPAFLFKYRVAAGENGSPFSMMLHRSGKICGSEEKENREFTEREFSVGTRKRRKLQSSILQCRHCEESFTSKISFRIHQRKHTADARRRGMLEGQESSCVLSNSEVKPPTNESTRDKRSNRKVIPNRLDQLLANRNKEQRVIHQTPLPKDDREELKANTLAAVRNMLSRTKNRSQKRGRYNKFPPEIQEEIAQHALKYGNMSAVNHFSEELGCAVSESTVRNIVKTNQKFPPEMKEEIGRYATAFGVNACSTFFSESLGMTVRHSLVRKFQNEYVLRYPEVASAAKAVLENGEIDHGKVCPAVEKGKSKSSRKLRHHTIFTPEIREEIGSFASRFTVSDTIEHFSARFLLKKSTVIKYRKMFLDKTQPAESNELPESTVMSSTSQTIDIMNASLSLLNNPQLSSSATTSICGNLYQPLSDNDPSSLLYSAESATVPYSKESKPARNNLLENLNSDTLQLTRNDFGSYTPLEQVENQVKTGSLFEPSIATHFSDNVMFIDAHSHSITPLTTATSSSSTFNSSQPHCNSLSPTSALFVLPTQQLTLISPDKQECHNPVNKNNSNQNLFKNSDGGKEIIGRSGFISECGEEGERIRDATEMNIKAQDSNLQNTNGSEFSGNANISTVHSPKHQRQIIARSAKKIKAVSVLQKKSKATASKSEEDDDHSSDQESLPVATKKQVKLLPKKKRVETKVVIEKRGAYTIHSPEMRARMGKFAVEHGNQMACMHFGSLLGHVIPESTVRGLRDKYLLKREQLSGVRNVQAEVNSLGYFPRGRPTRLGKYDEVVQDCVRELMKSGEKVSTALVIATAKQVLVQNEPMLLEENGGTTNLNITWAKSFMRRIGIRNNC